MAQKRYLDLLDAVEIYRKSAGYTDAEITAKVTNKLGVASGIATLGSDGKVPAAQLPSFVDDVVEAFIVSGATALSAGWLSATSGGSAFTPETGKIYVIMSDGEYKNQTFRWATGSPGTYVKISGDEGWIQGKASGTTENHIVTWGANGYSVKDSGETISSILSDAASTSAAKLLVGDGSAITQDSATDVEDPTIVLYQNSSVKSHHEIKGGTNIKVEWDASEEAIVITNTYTPESHYQAKNIVGASDSAKANAAVSNENGVYLNLIENDTVRSHHKFDGATETVGDGASTEGSDTYKKAVFKSDSNGNVTLDLLTATTLEVSDAIDAYQTAYDSASGTASQKHEAGLKAVRAFMHNEWVA